MVFSMIYDRMQYLQDKFPCRENSIVITDCNHDEVYETIVCTNCGGSVKAKLTDGRPQYRQLSQDELDYMLYKFKGTPGPWKTYSDAVDRESYVGNCRVVATIDGFQGHVEIVDTNKCGYIGFSSEAREANAKLIALSPELLNSLNQAIQWCQQKGENRIGARPDWLADAKKIVDKATYMPPRPFIRSGADAIEVHDEPS